MYIYDIYIHTYIYMIHIYTYEWSSCKDNIYATHCNTLQHTATHCNTLQHNRHCNTLQHTATHSNDAPAKIVRIASSHLVHTGWRRRIGSPQLQIIFHKTATKYMSLLRKITYKDNGSYESSPPVLMSCKYTSRIDVYVYLHHINIYIYVYIFYIYV